MFVMASVIVLLVEALVVVLLLVGALLWLFFLLRRPRPRHGGPDPTTCGWAEGRGFPRRPYAGSKVTAKPHSHRSGE